MLYVTIDSAAQFSDMFYHAGRGEQFSYEALEALYEYYNEFGDYELDVVAVCCDWCEHGSLDEALEACGAENLDELQDNNFVILLKTGSVLVQA